MSKEFENFRAKIEHDYNEIYSEMLEKSKGELINSAYELAHYNEIVNICDCLSDNEEDGWSPFNKEEYQEMADRKDNILKVVWESWLNYSHPERYNFFEYESLIDIISYALLDK